MASGEVDQESELGEGEDLSEVDGSGDEEPVTNGDEEPVTNGDEK